MGYFEDLRESVIGRAAEITGAVPADIPGLWFVRGYPELTTGQLVSIAFPGYTGTPLGRDSGSHATALRRETGAARKGGRA